MGETVKSESTDADAEKAAEDIAGLKAEIEEPSSLRDVPTPPVDEGEQSDPSEQPS